jgi:hypothetical protein
VTPITTTKMRQVTYFKSLKERDDIRNRLLANGYINARAVFVPHVYKRIMKEVYSPETVYSTLHSVYLAASPAHRGRWFLVRKEVYAFLKSEFYTRTYGPFDEKKELRPVRSKTKPAKAPKPKQEQQQLQFTDCAKDTAGHFICHEMAKQTALLQKLVDLWSGTE